jgi:phosphoglycolate phosphatase-like HAD superfamily hydrolase
MIKVIILDFDGVLIESNAVKDRAMERVFAAFPQHMAQIMSYHRSAAAIRFEKFRYIYANILKLSCNSAEEARCARVFSDVAVSQSVACEWVPGAEDFLQVFSRRVPMYLASINPPEDLDAVLEGRGIAQFFKGVLTATASKAGILKEILVREQVSADEAVFIGDSSSDYRSSVEAGIPFIGRQAEYVFLDKGVRVYNDMTDIKEVVLKAAGLNGSITPFLEGVGGEGLCQII